MTARQVVALVPAPDAATLRHPGVVTLDTETLAAAGYVVAECSRIVIDASDMPDGNRLAFAALLEAIAAVLPDSPTPPPEVLQ